MTEKLKLNLGGGPKKIEGYTNVDVQEWDGVTQVKHDLTVYPWPFEKNTVAHIICEEVLEHISFRETYNFLSECYRILEVDGEMSLQVPDCGKAMEYYVNGEICDCVPHKAKSVTDFKSDSKCFKCSGKGKIHPDRWLYSFTGAQKHSWDIHRNIFSKQTLDIALRKVGFYKIEFKENPNKLIVIIQK